MLQKPIGYLGGYIPLADSGLDYLQNITQRKLGYRLGTAHILLLPGGFRRTQGAENVLAGDQFPAQEIFIGKILPVRERALLAAETLDMLVVKLRFYQLRRRLPAPKRRSVILSATVIEAASI